MSYVRHISRRGTPQTEPLPGQVPNSAGGFTYSLDKFAQLDRFLILGCEGGSYYSGERKLTKENASIITACLEDDPKRTVDQIVAISDQGRAIKNDTCVFALAIAASNPKSSAYALASLNSVCRFGTPMFQFVDTCDELRGWGRGLRNAVGNWYLDRTPDQLARQVTKYAQRNGWSHRDVLRLAHPTPTKELQEVFQFVCQYEKWAESGYYGHELLEAVHAIKTVKTDAAVVKLITKHGLEREHIPTQFLNSPKVWEALLPNLKQTALIRNLGKLTSLGLIKPLSKTSKYVYEQLTNEVLLRKGRVHPFSILLALKTYASGHGFRGSLSWSPDPIIKQALEQAFYLAFDAVEPTGKNFLFGIDVSGSMGSAINNTNVSCRSAAACLSMVSTRVEPNTFTCGFDRQFRDLGIHSGMSLEEVERAVYSMTFGTTDCAVAINYARTNKLEVDTFVIITDNETYAGRTHPTVALEEYRKESGRDAKMIVVGMTSTGFTIANPKDPRQLDIVGFDASGPQVISEFSK